MVKPYYTINSWLVMDYKHPIANKEVAEEIYIYHAGIQIIHDRGNHWIVVSTFNCSCSSIKIYDFLYTTVTDGTLEVMNNLFWILQQQWSTSGQDAKADWNTRLWSICHSCINTNLAWYWCGSTWFPAFVLNPWLHSLPHKYSKALLCKIVTVLLFHSVLSIQMSCLPWTYKSDQKDWWWTMKVIVMKQSE